MKNVIHFYSLLFTACIAVIVFAATSTVADYYLVEVLMKMSHIPAWVNSVLFIFLIVLFSYIFERGKSTRFMFFIFSIIGCLGIIGFLLFHERKVYAVTAPKIFSVYPNSGLQAQVITIRGIRFLPPEKRGKVYINKDEMIIKFWFDEIIMVEQPVSSYKGWTNLSIISSDGRVSNKFPYYIPRPEELK